jgi:hypothetical protein
MLEAELQSLGPVFYFQEAISEDGKVSWVIDDINMRWIRLFRGRCSLIITLITTFIKTNDIQIISGSLISLLLRNPVVFFAVLGQYKMGNGLICPDLLKFGQMTGIIMSNTALRFVSIRRLIIERLWRCLL